MKKIYISMLVLAAMAKAGTAAAQANSVVLIPTIGTQVLYPSITAAYANIPAATSSSWTIELLPAYAGTSETYPIQLTDKGLTPGGGVSITIRPSAGNNGETIARPAAAAGVVLQFNGADNVILDGRPGGVASVVANYLSVNDPFVGSNTNRNIELLNAANNNTIQYITCTAADATAAGAGSRVVLIGSTTTTGNNNNIIQNCAVTGGLRGIQDFGLSDAVPNNGSKILFNTVRNFGAIGIFAGTGQSNITINNNTVSMVEYNAPVAGAVVGIQQQSLVAGTTSIADNTVSFVITSAATTAITGIVDIAVGTENILRNSIPTMSAPSATSLVGLGTYSNGVTTFNVLNNVVTGITGVAATSVIGMNLGTSTTPGATTFNFRANTISDLSSSAVVNIRAMSIFPPPASTLNIVNSFIALTQPNATASAIFGVLLGNTVGSNYTGNIYYNSVRIGGTSSATSVNTYGIYKADANLTSTFNIRNNISVVDRSFATGFLLGNTSGTLSIDYNNYFATGSANSSYPATSPAFYYDTSAAGLAAYKSELITLEQNSTFNTVVFAGSNDLHLAGASITSLALKAIPISGITTDIDGNTRSATAPTKGADEPGQPVPVKMITFTGTAKGFYNQLNWSTVSEDNNAGFELQRAVDGRNFTALGFVASAAVNGTSNSRLDYSFNDMKPLDANSFYRLKQSDKDGRVVYSAIVTIQGRKGLNLQITNIYPNPVMNELTLALAIKSSSTITLSITDMSGKLMMQKIIAAVAGENTLKMDTRILGSGVYNISAVEHTTGDAVTMRFVK